MGLMVEPVGLLTSAESAASNFGSSLWTELSSPAQFFGYNVWGQLSPGQVASLDSNVAASVSQAGGSSSDILTAQGDVNAQIAAAGALPNSPLGKYAEYILIGLALILGIELFKR